MTPHPTTLKAARAAIRTIVANWPNAIVESDIALLIDEECHVSKMVEALREFIELIHVFHGEAAWEIYSKHSPEMKRFNALLAKVTK